MEMPEKAAGFRYQGVESDLSVGITLLNNLILYFCLMMFTL